MTFNVLSWKGVLMPEVKEPIFPTMNCVTFPFTSVTVVTSDRWLTQFAETQVWGTEG